MAAVSTNRALLARIADLDNLRAAWERVRSRRALGGIDGSTVDDFAGAAERNLDRLRTELLDETYVPQPVRELEIAKLGKPAEKRTLGLPCVYDKVAQEATRRIVEPRLDREFLDCSYGYRPGRGPQRAVKRVSHYLLPEQRGWVVTADIDNFFGTVGHEVLIAALRPRLGDEAVIRLVRLWVEMGAICGNGRWRDVYGGVQQGFVLSPLLANLYLHPFDQSLTSRGYALVRYADDFVMLCQDRREAEAALADATTFLTERLGLRLNPEPRPIVTHDDGFAFLGIWFQGGRRSIAAAKIEGARFRLQQVVRRGLALDRALHAIGEMAAGWRRYYGQIVEPTELAVLDEAIGAALAELLRAERLAARLRSRDDASQLLRHVQLVGERSEADRRGCIDAIIAKAFVDNSGGDPPPHPRRRAGRHRQQGPSGRPGAPVAAAVRRRKRQHLRETAHLAELVISTPGSFLGKTSRRVAVRHERRTVCEAAAAHLEGITIAGHGISLSADVVRLCAQERVPLLFVSDAGRLEALLAVPGWSDGRITLLQARTLADPPRALDIARRLVAGKLRAQMNLIKYMAKYHRRRGDEAFATAVRSACEAISALLQETRAPTPGTNGDAWRGQLFSIEGRGAGHYWDVVRRVLSGYAPFPGRVREGAKDLVNCLLNYGYAVLQRTVLLALARAGLNPQLSFLHALQDGTPTLVFDLMEEFRPPVVDRTVIAMLTRRQPVQVDETGKLSSETCALLIGAVHERLAALLSHRGRTCTLREVIDIQARRLVTQLEGGKPYRAFLSKW